MKGSFSRTTGGETATENTHTTDLTVKVPPRSVVVAHARALKSELTVPFTAQLEIRFKSGWVDTMPIQGVFSGLQVISVPAEYDQPANLLDDDHPATVPTSQ